MTGWRHQFSYNSLALPAQVRSIPSFYRDPELFKVILNYLRTRSLVISGVDVKQLLHEAEYYGISALVKQGGNSIAQISARVFA